MPKNSRIVIEGKSGEFLDGLSVSRESMGRRKTGHALIPYTIHTISHNTTITTISSIPTNVGMANNLYFYNVEKLEEDDLSKINEILDGKYWETTNY